jgi:cell division protein FtsW (lipid II flippase)
MKTKEKMLYWTPRILCILAIAFISLFALDVFDNDHPLSHQLVALLIHLIPSFILLAFLLIAWKWEYTGGIFFIVIGVLASPLVFQHNYHMNHSVWISLTTITLITVPFIIVGVLFLVSSSLKRRHRQVLGNSDSQAKPAGM